MPRGPPPSIPFNDVLRQTFAFGVTVGVLVGNAAPLLLLVKLALDQDVVFWIGRSGLLALAVPPYLSFYYWGQSFKISRGRASGRAPLLIVMVAPSLLLLLLSWPYVISAWYITSSLSSQNCAFKDPGLSDRGRLEEAHMEAQAAYDKCYRRLLSDNNGGLLQRRPLLQSCEEWTEAGFGGKPGTSFWGWLRIKWGAPVSGKQREVEYLANVESRHVCGGFCKSGPMLWTSPEMDERTACAGVLAKKFLFVERTGIQAMVCSLLMLVFGICTFVALSPHLERLSFA